MHTSGWGSGRQGVGSGGTDTQRTAAPDQHVSRTRTALASEDFIPFWKFPVSLCSPLVRPPHPHPRPPPHASLLLGLLGHTRPGPAPPAAVGAPAPPLSAQPALPASLRPSAPATAMQGRAQTLPVPSVPRTRVGGCTSHRAGTTPASRSPSSAGTLPWGPREREEGTTPLWRRPCPHGRRRSTPRCPGSASQGPPAVTAVADTGTVLLRWSTTPVTAGHVDLLSREQKCHGDAKDTRALQTGEGADAEACRRRGARPRGSRRAASGDPAAREGRFHRHPEGTRSAARSQHTGDARVPRSDPAGPRAASAPSDTPRR